MARVLVAFYSRTGRTRRAAERLAQATGADLAEIRSETSFSGLLGLARAVWAARRGIPCPVAPIGRDLSAYDLVLIGTPIWAGRIAPPTRGFILANKARIRDYACFYTCAGPGGAEAGEDMARLFGPSPRAVLDLSNRDEGRPAYEEKLATYLRELELA